MRVVDAERVPRTDDRMEMLRIVEWASPRRPTPVVAGPSRRGDDDANEGRWLTLACLACYTVSAKSLQQRVRWFDQARRGQ